MKRGTLRALGEARERGRALVRAVELATGGEKLIDDFGDDSPLARTAAEAARRDRSGIVEIEGQSWFLEVHNPPLDLRVVGAVHIAQSLARMAALADYRVTVIDPRTAFASEERFPDALLSHDWPDEAIVKAPLGPRSAVVVLTHDPKIDDPALVAALGSDCFYIGALGSKKTHAARLSRLKSQGVSDGALARIHGPVGLAIGARSPAEIAVSIVAEMTMRLRADAGWERSDIRATAGPGISPRS
ncbi:MAG TPA: XdhC family protein [Rhizomicrobium sp.]|jgi:xanthine dehydrogenase accessory factor|nr:XdhC family protein [Rhizomicrobium sp.]